MELTTNAVATQTAQQFDGLVGAIFRAYHLPYEKLSDDNHTYWFGVINKVSQSYTLAIDKTTQDITFVAQGFAIEKFLEIYFWHYKKTTPIALFLNESSMSKDEVRAKKDQYNNDAKARLEKVLGVPVTVDLFAESDGITNSKLSLRFPEVTEQTVHIISTILQYSGMKPKVAPAHYAL